MKIVFFMEIFRYTKFFCVRPDIAESGLSRFFHDIAKFSGKRQFSFPRKDRYFNGQRVTAKWGISQTRGHADLIFGFRLSVMVKRLSEKFFDRPRRDRDGFFARR